ncbi:MAG: NAD-dependent deacylase [Candidatus Kapabacteria bacterium]|nr:NAD-dependent deacylase [Ignavibacteriota bacterium]MCW5884374.1 NAD-dependent deacylase [Candidatus Kapabacteria bacterium]
MQIPHGIIESLLNAKKVVVFTGAGISAESGIKTFRDPDGLWAKFNPSELASVDGFMSNPNLVWDWYQHRRDIIFSCEPNPGHYAIAEMQKLFPKFSLVTQNVDRLHQRAGAKDVIELHGNILENYCLSCKTPYDESVTAEDTEAPKCKSCGGLVRPAVVWFGETLPYDALMRAEEVSRKADVFFTAGTSGEVYPAANLPIIASQSGSVVVEINPNETAISRFANYCLRYPSGEAFPKILEEFNKQRGIH